MNPPLPRRHSARLLLIAAVMLALCGGSTLAAQLSEPDTILYGRVVQRVGDREFRVTRGQLVWTLRTSVPTPREFQVRGQLRPQADGRSSYQLRIPHQLLANDLAVEDGRIAVTGGTHTLQPVSVLLDGQPLALVPLAVTPLSVTQANRARAWRIDLELPGPALDSDGDGLPDAWEDAQGLDKWNPNDAAELAASEAAAPVPPAARDARTFAEWRAAYFPQDQRPLELFGEEDPDGDGVPNLIEYAFDLDPTRAAPAGTVTSPRLVADLTRPGLAFRRRAKATDLEFHVDAAEQLGAWRDATADLESAAAPAGAPDLTVLVLRASSPAPDHLFLRLRVVRH